MVLFNIVWAELIRNSDWIDKNRSLKIVTIMSKANKILPVANETHLPKDQEKNIIVLARVR